MSNRLLGLFAKFWTPGRVKTRLGAKIGLDRSALLHRCFVETLAERFSGTAERCVLAFTPQESRAGFAEISRTAWELVPQADGDLGQRMAAFFEYALNSGVDRVVLIGSDSPTLPEGYVEQAFQALTDHRVVLGPSEDGGYYLVGASGHVPPIFESVDWGTESVWEQTIRHLKRHTAPFAILAPWYDVDTYDDLLRLRDELQATEQDSGLMNRLRDAVKAAIDHDAIDHDATLH